MPVKLKKTPEAIPYSWHRALVVLCLSFFELISPRQTLAGTVPIQVPSARPTPLAVSAPIPTPTSPPTLAPIRACITDAQRSDFFNTFKITAWNSRHHTYTALASFDNCDDSNLGQSLVRAYADLKLLNELPSAPNAFDPGIVGDSPVTYFTRRITAIQIEPPTGTCTWADAYVEDSLPTMHICPSYILEAAIQRTSILIHEARHVDGYPHVHCLFGRRAIDDAKSQGTGECDTSFEQQGSYGVETAFFVRIARARLSTETDQMSARAFAVANFFQDFNLRPFNVRTGALLKTVAGPTNFYDGNRSELFVDTKAEDKIYLRYSDMPMIFNPQARRSSAYYGNHWKDWGPSKNYVNDSWGPVTDLVNQSGNMCAIFPEALICISSDTKTTAVIEFKNFKAERFIPLSYTYETDNVYGFTGTDGKVYRLPTQMKDLLALGKTLAFEEITTLKTQLINQVYLAPTRKLFLFKNGAIGVGVGDGKTAVPAGIEPTERFSQALGPLTWSRKLEEL